MNRAFLWGITSATIILLCIFSYNVADITTALWFHALGTTWLYELFGIITFFGDSLAYLLGGMILYIFFRKKKTHVAYAGLFLFTTVAVSGLSADLVKFICGRARPNLYFDQHLYGFAFFQLEKAWTSFPSGHSATALSVAMVVVLLYPRWKTIALFAGFMVAFSRIVLAQHYISDVLAGSFLGIASTILLYNHYFKSKLDASETIKI
ncbi:MAG: phosphatase PAP2 family protein [Chlorobium sp.]|nr:MAG: phosphatase PAP2 family protein [Chlorobium sp.]